MLNVRQDASFLKSMVHLFPEADMFKTGYMTKKSEVIKFNDIPSLQEYGCRRPLCIKVDGYRLGFTFHVIKAKHQ